MTSVRFETAALKRALRQEAEKGVELLPASPIDLAVRAAVARTADHVEALLARGLDVHQAPVVYARKSRSGYRPLTLLTLAQRVHLRALINSLEESLSHPARDREAYQSFAVSPLEQSEASYVVMTDVAEFYNYVDHEELALEIVRRSGRDSIAEDISLLLGGYSGRVFGLPQTSYSSDFLSEIYIDAVTRRLQRKGWAVWRYNDDFRIACSTWFQAQEALQALVALLRQVGLVINEGKTYILKRETYRDWLKAPEVTWTEATTAVGVDPDDWLTYADEGTMGLEDDEEDNDEDLGGTDRAEAALQVVEYWEYTAGPKAENGTPRMAEEVARRLLRRALAILGQEGSSEPLEDLRTFLIYEPGLTPSISAYMREAAVANSDAVSAAVEDLSGSFLRQLSDWQSIWLLEPFADLIPLDEVVREWCIELVEGPRSSLVRARAAMALASEEDADMRRLLELYETAEPVAHPEVVAAIAMQAGIAIENSHPEIYNDNLLNAVVADWVESSK